MKFRSMLCVGVLAASAAMAADVEGLASATLGWLKVESSAKCTIIAVPWLNVGGGDVEVAKLVKTDSLSAGDKLYYYDGANYWGWILTESEGVKSWTPQAVTYKENGQDKTAAGATATEAKLPRSKALMIERGTTTAPIYLYGQYSSDTIAAAATGGGSSSDAVYTLMANPRATSVDLNTVASGTPNAADQIVIPNNDGTYGTPYTYVNGKWGRTEQSGSQTITIGGKTYQVPGSETRVETAVVPAGRGFWYISKGGSQTFTF